MNFAFVSTMGGVPWAGSEELWCGAASRLLEMGHQVSANCVRHPRIPEKLDSLRRKGARIHRRHSASRMTRLRRCFQRGSKFARAAAWIRSECPDRVVISQSCQDGVAWGRACLDLSIPFDFITQVVAEFFWPDDKESGEAAEVMSKARRCFFVSKRNLELTERQLGIELPNAEVVWNPFAVPWAQDSPWPDQSTLRIACVARLDPRHKGQDLLIRALADSRWKSRDIHLSFVGEGSSRQSLQRLARTCGLKSVEFCGHRSDVANVWDHHHVLSIASRVEGMPLAAIEAMVCGRPCLLTDVGGNAELVSDGLTGWVASAPSVEAVSKALDRCWEQRESIERMGMRARRWVDANVPEDPCRDFAKALFNDVPKDNRATSLVREVA